MPRRSLMGKADRWSLNDHSMLRKGQTIRRTSDHVRMRVLHVNDGGADVEEISASTGKSTGRRYMISATSEVEILQNGGK